MHKKLNRITRNSIMSYALVIAFFVIMQINIAGGNVSSSLKGQLVPICAYVVMAVSLNLTVGILGELSLGHAGFMSVGAFTAATVAAVLEAAAVPAGARLAAAMVFGALFAGAAGFIVGVPILRLKGDYLAIVTLAFGEIIKDIINCLYIGIDASGFHFSITDEASLGLDAATGRVILGGPMGATGITKISTFTSGFILIIISLFIIYNLINSRTGRAVMSIRDNRIAAESVGINITKYKLTAFVTSAALAGAAGALFALNYSAVVPTKFNFNTSILVLVFVVLGGMGNIFGSIITSALLTILPEMLRAFNDYRMLVYALVLIVVMIVTNNEKFISMLETYSIKLGRKKSKGERKANG